MENEDKLNKRYNDLREAYNSLVCGYSVSDPDVLKIILDAANMARITPFKTVDILEKEIDLFYERGLKKELPE